MITVQHAPGSRRQYAIDPTLTRQQCIAGVIQCGGDWMLWLNGIRVDDPGSCAALDETARADDQIMLVHRPSGTDPITMTLAAWRGTEAAVSALVPRPDVPSYDTSASTSTSPNSRLTGLTNVARPYQAIPDIYGYMRAWPDLIQPSTWEYVNNIKRVTEWLCVSRGTGLVTAIQYADTPLSSISGASALVFGPAVGSDGYFEHGETTITDVLETFDSPDINGQEIGYPSVWPTLTDTTTVFNCTSGSATFTLRISESVGDLSKLASIAGSGSATVAFNWTPSGGGITPFSATVPVVSYSSSAGEATVTFTAPAAFSGTIVNQTVSATVLPIGADYSTLGPYTLSNTADRIRWHVNFLRGLRGSVQIRIDWYAIDSGGATIAGSSGTSMRTFTADSIDQQFFTFDEIPSYGLARYRVSVTRLTNALGNDADVAKLEEVQAARYYATKTLPGVTIIRCITTATSQATGYSERKINCRFTRYVRGWSSPAASASRNAYRAMLHMWSLAGRSDAEMDISEMQALSAQHGEDSPLLRLDHSFDDLQVGLGARLQVAANAARSVVFRDGVKWTVYRDQAQPLGPTMQLDYRNLAAGGESQLTINGHLPASNDGVEVEYIDEPEQKAKRYIRLRADPATGIVSVGSAANPLKIQLIGCRTEAQALNRAHLEVRKLLYRRQRVSDSALSDVNACRLGDCVRWVDPADIDGDDGLQAGEIIAVDGLTLTTSEPLNFGGMSSGRIILTDDSGAPSAQIICSPRTDGVTGCVLSASSSALYLPAADQQAGSRYAFAAGITESELAASGLYTLSSKKHSADGIVSIELDQYDARYYEMD